MGGCPFVTHSSADSHSTKPKAPPFQDLALLRTPLGEDPVSSSASIPKSCPPQQCFRHFLGRPTFHLLFTPCRLVPHIFLGLPHRFGCALVFESLEAGLPLAAEAGERVPEDLGEPRRQPGASATTSRLDGGSVASKGRGCGISRGLSNSVILLGISPCT